MAQKRYLQIADFDGAQMYKDRSPIWIKLHCSILDDYEFAQIPDETKFHALGLMILAARLNNKFPDDERWLRQKINANSEINLKLLLEIGFLTAIKGARNSLNAAKANKIKGKSVKQSEKLRAPEQNKTEEIRREHNTPKQNANADDGADTKNVVMCDFSKSAKTESANPPPPAVGTGSIYSLADCLRYAKQSENIKNPQGLANHLFKTGNSDSFICAALYPQQQSEIDREIFGEPIKFTDEPCVVCFGAKMANVDGKGNRRCVHCRNERGKATGLEPAGEKHQ